jgi:quercetin dioxygenase-like cupin family protein
VQILLAAVLAVNLTAAAQAQTQPTPVQPPPIKRTILQQSDVPGTNLEVIYATVEITAGFKAGRHLHPGTIMAQVTEGEFWIQFDGQAEKIIKVGESFTVPDRAIHSEGANTVVKLNAVYVLEKGKPLASPAP